ncbi:hypothetical protein C6A74_24860 [Escherichia coli]|nr:hypothetical protein [Escherichia coli]RCA37068.1 hypothetical protein C6A74_24860 [Escherichia coli]
MNSIALNSDFLFSRAGKAQMSMAMVFSAVAIFHSLLLLVVPNLKWFTEFGHLNRGDMLTSEQHRCHNEKKKFQRRV